jgi:hypothetical protein
LSAQEIERAIEQIETALDESHAIARLNSDVVSKEERESIAEQFKKLNRLRERDLALQLVSIEDDVRKLEQGQAARLEAYGIKR